VRSTFQWWRWRLSREGVEQATRSETETVPALLPVRVVSTSPALEAEAGPLELELPSGVRLRVPEGFDARTVAGVLWALSEVGQC
jgi:hypothetical protein